MAPSCSFTSRFLFLLLSSFSPSLLPPSVPAPSFGAGGQGTAHGGGAEALAWLYERLDREARVVLLSTSSPASPLAPGGPGLGQQGNVAMKPRRNRWFMKQ